MLLYMAFIYGDIRAPPPTSGGAVNMPEAKILRLLPAEYISMNQELFSLSHPHSLSLSHSHAHTHFLLSSFKPNPLIIHTIQAHRLATYSN